MRELVEVTFRQVSVIALACAILRMLTTINGIENGLDSSIFARVYRVPSLTIDAHVDLLLNNLTHTREHTIARRLRDNAYTATCEKRRSCKRDIYTHRIALCDVTLQVADLGEEKLLTEVFFAVQNMVDNYLLIYVAYVILFVILAYFNFRWLNKAEELTVEEIVTHYPKSSYLEFVVARYEYIERIAGRDIPGLDPKGCWFMEYYRACLLNTAITLIRVPNITLIIFQFLIWALL